MARRVAGVLPCAAQQECVVSKGQMCRDMQVLFCAVSGLRPPCGLGFRLLQVCGKTDLFRPQVWRGDNCARQDETNPGERGYSMSGGNRFTDGFSSVRGLSAMPPALMFAKPFDQHLCGLTSGNAPLSFLAKGSFAKMR